MFVFTDFNGNLKQNLLPFMCIHLHLYYVRHFIHLSESFHLNITEDVTSAKYRSQCL